jgi:hypothetical protein
MARGRRRGAARAVGVSAEVLSWALDGLQREIGQTKERLAELTARAREVRAALDRGGRPAAETTPPAAPAAATPRQGRRRKRRLSAEGRKRIREALKRRWERFHEQQARRSAKKSTK